MARANSAVVAALLGRIAPPDIAHGTHRASRTRPSRRGPERSVLDRSPRSRRDVHDTEGVLGRRRAALGNAVPSERIDTGGTACPRLGRIRSRCTTRPWPRIVATRQLAVHAQAGLHARLGHSIRGEAWVRQTDDAGQRASGAGDSSIVLKRRFAIDEASALGSAGLVTVCGDHDARRALVLGARANDEALQVALHKIIGHILKLLACRQAVRLTC